MRTNIVKQSDVSFGTALHWAENWSYGRNALCGKPMRATAQDYEVGFKRMCGSCTRIMAKRVEKAHAEALIENDARVAADQVWECRDEVGRTGEQVRITSIYNADGGTHVEFIVSKAAKGYEAELGSDGSMEATEFKQRYQYLPANVSAEALPTQTELDHAKALEFAEVARFEQDEADRLAAMHGPGDRTKTIMSMRYYAIIGEGGHSGGRYHRHAQLVCKHGRDLPPVRLA